MTTNIGYPRYEIQHAHGDDWLVWALFNSANSRKILGIVDCLSDAYDLVDRLKKAPIVVRRGAEEE